MMSRSFYLDHDKDNYTINQWVFFPISVFRFRHQYFHFIFLFLPFNSFEFCPGKFWKWFGQISSPAINPEPRWPKCEFDIFGGGPIAHNNHAFLYVKYSEVEKKIFKIILMFTKKLVFHPWGWWGHEFILLHTKRCKSQNVVISSFQNRN